MKYLAVNKISCKNEDRSHWERNGETSANREDWRTMVRGIMVHGPSSRQLKANKYVSTTVVLFHRTNYQSNVRDF